MPCVAQQLALLKSLPWSLFLYSQSSSVFFCVITRIHRRNRPAVKPPTNLPFALALWISMTFERSQWAGIDGLVFANIIRALPFENSVASEVVCKAWREQLLYRSSPELYCCGAILTDCSESIKNPICFYRHLQPIELPGTATDSFALGRWLSRRAEGIGSLEFTNDKDQRLPGSRKAVDTTQCLLSFLDGLQCSTSLALNVNLRGTVQPCSKYQTSSCATVLCCLSAKQSTATFEIVMCSCRCSMAIPAPPATAALHTSVPTSSADS